jgi:hypothetical protein
MIVAFACLGSLPLFAQVPIGGRNVNMVSGITWPDGDPFLQRQNEPSIAISTRNPSHLLAGANDYRTVDLSIVLSSANPDAQVVGDAWLSVFKSFDGGQTWRSNLLPGCRYAVAQCQGSPVTPLAYQAGADPVVRAGPNGMFFYSALAFDRDHSRSALFVSRYIDDNNREGSVDNTIRYLDAEILDQDGSGQFIDKPWVAVDIPRGSTATCSIPASGTGPAQSFPAFNVYVSYARFTGTNNSAQIYLSRSTDCGVTWSKDVKVNPGTAKPQGSVLAIDPNSGAVYLAWRQFQLDTTQPDAMKVVKSTDGGATFGPPVTVSNIVPFDLNQSSYGIRTLSFPTMGVDSAGRVYVAWAARQTTNGDSRIFLSTSADGSAWSAPQMVEQPQPLYDNSLQPSVLIQSGLGHQFMPSISIVNGKVAIAYYSLYEDSTVGQLLCPPGSLCNSIAQFFGFRRPFGTLSPAPPSSSQLATVFGPGLLDQAVNGGAALTRRHTMDVRVALAATGASPSFIATRVSEYLFGSPSTAPGTVKPIQQLRFNVPNLPLFVQGTEPFMGDYLDVTAQSMIPGQQRGTWTYNTSTAVKPQFYAAWTDNRDVRPPADGDWTHYTPILPSGFPYSGFPQFPACVPGQAGMRNQNVYAARVTEGLLVSVPGNSKQLSTTLQRGFSVVVQNNTDQLRSYRLTIANQPVGGQASFLQKSLLATLDASAAPRSSFSRTVFVTSSDPLAQITVNVVEITAPGGTVVTGGQQSSVLLNPDPTNPILTTPDNTIQTTEIYLPELSSLVLTNPDTTNPDTTNPDIMVSLAAPDTTNPDTTNPDTTNPGTAAPDTTNPDTTNPDTTNPTLTFADISTASLTDVTRTITNGGNTTSTFKIRLVTPNGQASVPPGFKVQLILHKIYSSPAVSKSGCSLIEIAQNVLVANITNPVFFSPTSPNLSDPDITNPDPSSPTITLAPGEVGRVTLRIQAPTKAQAVQFATNGVQPVVISQAVSTGAAAVAATLIITTFALPAAQIGMTYNAQIQTLGGTGAITFSLASGTLPPGLGLNPSTGAISGVPTANGSFNFTIRAVDSGNPQQTATQALTLVSLGLTITTQALPIAEAGGPYNAPVQTVRGTGPLTFSLASGSLPPGLNLNASTGVVSGSTATTGFFNFTVGVVDSGNPQQSAAQALTIVVPPSGGILWHGTFQVEGTNTTGNVLQTVADGAAGIAFDGVNLYFATFGVITKRSPDGNTVIATLPYIINNAPTTPTQDMAWDSKRARLWIVYPSFLQRLNPATGSFDATYSIFPGATNDPVYPRNPIGVAYDPALDRLYISFCKGNCLDFSVGVVSAYDASTGAFLNDLFFTSGYAIGGMAFDPITRNLWACSWDRVTTPLIRNMTLGGATLSSFPSPNGGFDNGLELMLLPTLSISTVNLPLAHTNTPYSTQVQTIGGAGLLTFSLASGSLPPGMNLNASTGVISGMTSTAGFFTFTVNVVDSGNPQQSATRSLSITVPPAGGMLWLGNHSCNTSDPATVTDTSGNLLRTVQASLTGIAFDGVNLFFSDCGATITKRTADANTLLATFPSFDSHSEDMAWDSRRNRIWRIGGNGLERLDPNTGGLEASYSLPTGAATDPLYPRYPIGIAYDAALDRLYISFCPNSSACGTFANGAVSVFDPSNGAFLNDLFLTSGYTIGGLAFDPISRTLWAASWAGGANPVLIRNMTLGGATLSSFPAPSGKFAFGLELIQ